MSISLLYARVGHLVRRLQQISVAIFLEEVGAVGITPVQFGALTAIDGMGGGMRVGLFADTWAWGEQVGGPLSASSLAYYVQTAYRLPIFDRLWKPYFRFEHIDIAPADPVFAGVPERPSLSKLSSLRPG